MAGSRDARSDSGDDSSSARFLDNLKDRLIVALLAVIAGGGGAFGYMNANPPRPDPWTGTQAREAHQRIERRLDTIEHDDEKLRDKVDAHITRGEAGFWRIEQLERRVHALEQAR